MHRRGKEVCVSCVPRPGGWPQPAEQARQKALAAGVPFATTPPAHYELCIDALFGIGAVRPLESPYTDWIAHMNTRSAPVLAVDLPTGLDADHGSVSTPCVHADHTLSLLTRKPGLFTAQGRDVCGEIWFHALDVNAPAVACAQLNEAPVLRQRAHATHKGSYGDVAVVGGGRGMAGAAVLAASAALHGGAGRVYVALLDAQSSALAAAEPELMTRTVDQLELGRMTVVAGCGGGSAMHACLPQLLKETARLVLDADALNAIASDTSLRQLTQARAPGSTIITPHPLEAARLLGCDVPTLQSHRLHGAQELVRQFHCVAILKGSGSVIAAPDQLPRINTTGNAQLASAGTGDVLAGLVGALWAQGLEAFDAASAACYRHGAIADSWPPARQLTAGELLRAL